MLSIQHVLLITGVVHLVDYSSSRCESLDYVVLLQPTCARGKHIILTHMPSVTKWSCDSKFLGMLVRKEIINEAVLKNSP